MFRSLRADEVEARIAQVGNNAEWISVLLYKDARCDMNMLDETFGMGGWQREHELIDGQLFCKVGIYVQTPNGYQWVWKQDVGTESYTEKEKGRASDAFKRACFNIGIGRELYTAPQIFIWQKSKEDGLFNYELDKNGKPRIGLKVTELEVKDGKITALKIANTRASGRVIFEWRQK